MLLRNELKLYGCDIEEDDFRDVIVEIHHGIAPDWTDEVLLCNPLDAERFCHAVRSRVGCLGLPDELICRTLINIRKVGRVNGQTARN